eukprot:4161013-Pyramimonas_sp.AAC.1
MHDLQEDAAMFCSRDCLSPLPSYGLSAVDPCGRVSSAPKIRVPLSTDRHGVSGPLQLAHLFECARFLEQRSLQRQSQGAPSPTAAAPRQRRERPGTSGQESSHTDCGCSTCRKGGEKKRGPDPPLRAARRTLPSVSGSLCAPVTREIGMQPPRHAVAKRDVVLLS